MSKKIYVDAKVSLVLIVEDEADVDEVMSNISFDVVTGGEGEAELLDFQIEEYSVQDSK